MGITTTIFYLRADHLAPPPRATSWDPWTIHPESWETPIDGSASLWVLDLRGGGASTTSPRSGVPTDGTTVPKLVLLDRADSRPQAELSLGAVDEVAEGLDSMESVLDAIRGCWERRRLEAGLARLDRLGKGNPRFLQQMVGLFLERTPEHVRVAREAWRDGDPDTARRRMHDLKSSAGMIGAETVQHLAERAEGLPEEFEVLLDRLESAWARSQAFLVAQLGRGESR
jgi:HPt (histidine-containing phosphotransfer) domain-containing protein